MANMVSIDPAVLDIESAGPRLIGSRCEDCGTHTFPAQDGCPRCAGSSAIPVELDRRGTLWTWTIQGFAPKAPPYIGPTDEAFEPFGIGYVELPGQVKVEARLTESDPARLRVGMAMELTTIPLAADADGNTLVTYGFRPVDADE